MISRRRSTALCHPADAASPTPAGPLTGLPTGSTPIRRSRRQATSPSSTTASSKTRPDCARGCATGGTRCAAKRTPKSWSTSWTSPSGTPICWRTRWRVRWRGRRAPTASPWSPRGTPARSWWRRTAAPCYSASVPGTSFSRLRMRRRWWGTPGRSCGSPMGIPLFSPRTGTGPSTRRGGRCGAGSRRSRGARKRSARTATTISCTRRSANSPPPCVMSCGDGSSRGTEFPSSAASPCPTASSGRWTGSSSPPAEPAATPG